MYGFDSAKDVLEVLLIPATGGLVALLWPSIQAFDKRRRFERLIARELEEVGPHPKKRTSGEFAWTKHQSKTFLHQRILDDSTTNRDFILSLDPTLTYLVTQLWDARRTGNGDQWLWYLKCLGERYGGEVLKAHSEWEKLLSSARDEI